MNFRRGAVGLGFGMILVVCLWWGGFLPDQGKSPDEKALRPPVVLETGKRPHFLAGRKTDGREGERGHDLAVAMPDQKKGDGQDLLPLFRYLGRKFGKISEFAGHMEAVSAWIKKRFAAQEANEMVALYREYMDCEIELSRYLARLSPPKSPEALRFRMKEIMTFRKERLGEDLARDLFFTDMQKRLYRLDRQEVLKDPDRLAEEKQAILEDLTSRYRKTGGAPEPPAGPYQQYQELLALHQKDLTELSSDQERAELKEKLKASCFSETARKRLDQVARQLRAEAAAEVRYRQAAAAIMEDAEIPLADRNDAVKKLQEETFGENAEAFRRREAMERGREKMHAKNLSDS